MVRRAYRSHLSDPSGPGMHLDLAFAQVVQALGPLFFAVSLSMASTLATYMISVQLAEA